MNPFASLRPAHYLWFVLLAAGSFLLAYLLLRPQPPAEPLTEFNNWQAPLLQPLAEGRLNLAQLVDAAPGELWLQPRLEGPRLLYRAGLAESGRSWAVEAELSLTTEQRQSLQRATAAQVADGEVPLGAGLRDELGPQTIAQLLIKPVADPVAEATLLPTFGPPRLRLQLAEGEAWVYPEQGLTIHLAEQQLVLLHWLPVVRMKAQSKD